MFNSRHFNLGHLVATRGINEEIINNKRFAIEVSICLKRYCVKDWGNISNEDKQANEDSLNNQDDIYILAAYDTCKGRIWIITNRATETKGDNVTTICFPDER